MIAAPRIAWTPMERAGAAATLALALAIVAWHAWLAPPTTIPAWFAIALHTAPLWPALVLFARGHRAAPFAAALAGLLLFALGVMEAWASPPARAFALLQAALGLAMVAGASVDGLRARFAKKSGV